MSADQQAMTNGATRRLVLRMGADGLPRDDVAHYSADRMHLHSYTQASEALSRFLAPVLFDRADPHSHLIVALMDGTGNDADQDPVHATNVAKFKEQVKKLNDAGVDRLHTEYTPGPGTQPNPLERTLDGALGRTSLERAEWTYASLVERAQGIFAADPNARISLHLEGFSRGASQVPLLARIIEQRGIPDPASSTLVRDAEGELRTVYTRYHQAPGQTLMSVGLYDPVPTGYMELMDRRLPPSVVSGFQISATHERRGLFPVDQILPQGASADGRFLHVSVAGAHSDIGGSYLRGGLGARSLNLMTDYHNSLFNEPLLPRTHEPLDPRLNVIHHSEHGNLLFRMAPKVERIALAGQVHQLAADASRLGAQGGIVHEPVQAPEPMRAELERAIPLRQPVLRAADAAAASIHEGDALLQKLRSSGVELRPYQAPMLERPGVRVAGAAGVLGVATSLHEAANTAQRVGLLYGLSNADAAQSELNQFAGRGLGSWSGGAAAGAAIGSGTGPGVLAFMAYGAVVGGTVGGRLAERWDQHQIFRQTDHEGIAWAFNGRQWLREELADLSSAAASGSAATDGKPGNGASNARLQSFSAQQDKASELDYRASSKAAALALGEVPTPRDPYSLPANAADRPSLRPANWEQDPQTRQWSRQVAAGYMEKGVPYYEQETASAQRSRELDLQSQRRLEDNVTHSRAALAARYEVVYAAEHWQRHGKVPAAVGAALQAEALVASDGRLYQRTAEGVWQEGERRGEGNVLRELEATHAVLKPALAEHRAQIATIKPVLVLTPRQQLHTELAATYRQHGLQPFPETLEAALDAVEKTRQAQDIAAGTTSLMLEPRQDGTWDVDSAIAHLQRIDGVVVKVAVTRTAELHEARQQRGHSGALGLGDLPEEASPWRARSDQRAPALHSTLTPPALADTEQSMPPAHPWASTAGGVARDQDEPQEQRTPMQPGHPDHALYQQIREGVADLDARHGRTFDETSERMAASLLVLAKRNGLTQVDHVMLSNATQDVSAGQRLFLVQGEADDPAHLRAIMETVDAAQAPIEESLQALDVVSRENIQRMQAEQQEQQMHDQRVQHEMQIIAASGGM